MNKETSSATTLALPSLEIFTR